MDTASLNQGLTFLAWTSSVFLIVIGIFLAKVLFDLSRLILSFNKTAELISKSAEPILADVAESVSIVNGLIKRTEENINKVKNLSANFTKMFTGVVSKASVVAGVVGKGVFTLIKSLFKK